MEDDLTQQNLPVKPTIERRPLRPNTLDALASWPRWVAWRQEVRRGKDGSEHRSKTPYDPNSQQQARIPTDPSTWSTRNKAEARCRTLLGRDDVGGVGIVLGDIGDGALLMGIDLDCCFLRDDTVAPWAMEVIERFNTYAEVSPSGQGVKLFFYVVPKDAAEVKALLGTNEKGELKTRRAFSAGAHREIAIDRARFYAVTSQRLENVPETLRMVKVADVRWFIEEAGPAYQCLHGVGGGEQQQLGQDETGSGYGFRFMTERKTAGDTYESAKTAIFADRGIAGEWARRVDERQLQRAWNNARTRRAGSNNTALEVVRVADVPMQPVHWVWPQVLARGKLTMFSGDPGAGKSTMSMDITARITNSHATWPSGEPAPSGSVIILSAEDAVNDTIHPRLVAAGADVSRVFVIRAVTDNNRRTFNLQRDLDQLEQLIEQRGDVIVVMIDPISSYMGAGIENNSTTSVRPVLELVSDMAERSGVAVLLIHHPSKDVRGKAMNAFSGSLAYIAAPRIGYLFVAEKDKNREETGRHLMLQVKNNLGPWVPGCGYYIKETHVQTKDGTLKIPYIEWDDAPVTVTADAALREPQPQPKLEQAIELLREQLANGPVDCVELIERAKSLDISERTMRQAKDIERVESNRNGFQGRYQWQLPKASRGE